MDDRDLYLVRVWLPDQPGALGVVTSSLGALHGDVVGLEIVERGGGLAIDELVVKLPAGLDVESIVNEIGGQDGVTVEDVRKLDGSAHDPQLEALEVAAIVLGAETRNELAAALCDHACRAVRLSWACVITESGGVLASWGARPNHLWLTSFVSGTPAVDVDSLGLELDTVWIPLPAASARLVVGRSTGAIRVRERRRLAALGQIADTSFRRMDERSMRC